jgi:hypothetical protein
MRPPSRLDEAKADKDNGIQGAYSVGFRFFKGNTDNSTLALVRMSL